jgi:integrase
MDELLPTFVKQLPAKGKLFPISVQSGATNRALNRIWDKAGLPKEKYKRGLQVLRHSWVTHMLQHPANLNHNTVAEFAGHLPSVQQDRYKALFKAGDRPFPMTCEKHGIGKPNTHQ